MLAGTLTTLSPCVLPVLPFVAFAALDRSRLGPVALAAGMAATFVAVGLLGAGAVPLLADSIGYVRQAAAWLMLGFGVVLVSPFLQARLAGALGGLSNTLAGRTQAFAPQSLGGQAALGALLGVVWTPCSGPTLGAAIGLAATSSTLPAAASIMLAFGFGASLPLVAIAYGSRQTLRARREALARVSRYAKPVLGAFMLAIGIAVLTGADKAIEAVLVAAMPGWLVDLTTKF